MMRLEPKASVDKVWYNPSVDKVWYIYKPNKAIPQTWSPLAFTANKAIKANKVVRASVDKVWVILTMVRIENSLASTGFGTSTGSGKILASTGPWVWR